MKILLKILCLILCVSLFVPVLVSCGNEKVYELGPYSIKKDEYLYLLSSYKRKIMDSLGINEGSLDYKISSLNMTYNQYIEKRCREEFEQSVFTLLYAQALFDEYDLKLSKSDKAAIKNSANAIIREYGDGRASTFNTRVKGYGFSNDTLYEIYEKQYKQNMVIKYLYGDNFSKITDQQKNTYYENNYLRFQAIVVNTLYYHNGKEYVNYTEDEQETRKALVNELTAFLCRNDSQFEYKVLRQYIGKDVYVANGNGEMVPNITYEELWENKDINFFKEAPGSYYMLKPNAYESMNNTPLTQANSAKVGEIKVIGAKNIFDGDGTIESDDGTTTIKKGDYIEYGSSFIKRLAMEDNAWKDAKYKEYFGDAFISGAAQHSIFYTLNKYADSCPYTLMLNNDLRATYSLESAIPNYVDYDYIHPSNEK